MESTTVCSIADVMQRYYKVRPPFIWQKGNTHLSFAQVKEAMNHVCSLKGTCGNAEWPSLIKELDRRYFLSEKLRWEFSSLDHFGDGLIPLSAAKAVALQVHGGDEKRGKRRFPAKAWKSFVEGRTLPNSLVAYEEVEVFLCNIYHEEWVENGDVDPSEALELTSTKTYKHYDSEDDIEDDLKAINLKFAMFEQMEKRRVEAEKGKVNADEEKKRKADENKLREQNEMREENARLDKEEADRLKAADRTRRKAEKREQLKAEKMAKQNTMKAAKMEMRNEEKVKKEAEEKAKIEEEGKARIESEEKARLEAEEKAKLEAKMKSKQEAEERAKQAAEEEVRIAAEEESRIAAEEKSKLEAKEKARVESEEKARLESEEKARLEAKEEARLQAEEKARIEAEESARLEAEEEARLEAEVKLRLEAEEKAMLEAEDKARLEAEEKVRLEAEEKAKLEAEERARLEAEKRALTPRQKQELAVRQKLKTSIMKKEPKDLEVAVNDFKKNKLEDTDGDLQKAERLIKVINTKMDLGQAVDKRLMAELERLMEVVKTEKLTEKEVGEELLSRASTLLTQLRKLERAQKDILDLKQSTIAEIRGYQNPPHPVHQIMTATLLLIGQKEKELKNWKTVQATLGKTGKEGIKRRILACKPEYVSHEASLRSAELLKGFDLVEIKDVSLGAGTFFVWANNMVESCLG